MNKCKVLPISLAMFALSGFVGTAVAENYPRSMEKDLISICKHTALNDRAGLHQSIKQLTPGKAWPGSTYRLINKGLMCNGMTVASFAQYYGAADTLAVFERYDRSRQRIEIKDIQVSRVPTEDMEIKVSFVASR